MNIERIKVWGLFDDLNHDLKFKNDEKIMLLTGLNGSGKTTILNLINVLFNKSLTYLCNIPFRKINIFFDNQTNLLIEKFVDHPSEEDNSLPLLLTLNKNGEKLHSFHPEKILSEDAKHELPLSYIDEIIPELHRVNPRKWINLHTHSTLDLTDILIEYSDHFRTFPIDEVLQIPIWFQDLKSSVNVRFIDTERLTQVDSRSLKRRRRYAPLRTVNHYSEHLANYIKDKTANYGTLSQSLDRTFPVRLVENRTESDLSVDSLSEELAEIEEKRVKLENAGLFAIEQSHLSVPDLSNIDGSQIGVLTVYARDAKKKLAVFDDLYEKVSVFQRILNARFSNKRVSVSDNGLQVCKNESPPLNLELLSSGEQHELVMLYDLLFRAPTNSLILIDEPEISLHVAWQEEWLDDLDEIAKLSDFKAIIATHSPEIIGRRLNLSVELHSSR